MFPHIKNAEDLMKFMNEALKSQQNQDKKTNSNTSSIDNKIIEMINKQNNSKK